MHAVAECSVQQTSQRGQRKLVGNPVAQKCVYVSKLGFFWKKLFLQSEALIFSVW